STSPTRVNGFSLRASSQSPLVYFSLNGSENEVRYPAREHSALTRNESVPPMYSHLEPVHPAVQDTKYAQVKRHHSTNDMLGADADFGTSPQIVRRPRRPKSEGNFLVEGFRSKRASSFGVGFPSCSTT
ncbi:hypothetical protein NP493_1869g00014, partial [Ridgeia piscesae]